MKKGICTYSVCMYGCTNKGKGDSVTVSEREGRKEEGRDGWRGERGRRKGGREEVGKA